MGLWWGRGLGRLIDELLVTAVQFVSLLTGALIYAIAAFGRDAPIESVILAWTVVVSGVLIGLCYEAIGPRLEPPSAG